MFCLVENETKVLKTGGKKLVKNKLLKHLGLSLHILLFQVFIFVFRQILLKSVQNLETTQGKLVDISSCVLHSVALCLLDYFSYESVFS